MPFPIIISSLTIPYINLYPLRENPYFFEYALNYFATIILGEHDNFNYKMFFSTQNCFLSIDYQKNQQC
jgi:hypothetical protein